MAKRIQLIRHTGAAATAFLGLEGEVTADLTNKALRVHDGLVAGGSQLAVADLANVAAATVSVAGKMSAAQVTELSAATAAITLINGTSLPAKADKVGSANVDEVAFLDAAGNLKTLAVKQGTGNGFDAGLLGGQAGSFYQDADNINAGTLALARLPAGIDAATLSGLTAANLLDRANHTGTDNIVSSTTGTLTVARGGTGATSFTANRLAVVNGGATALGSLSLGVAGQFLQGGSPPTWADMIVTSGFQTGVTTFGSVSNWQTILTAPSFTLTAGQILLIMVAGRSYVNGGGSVSDIPAIRVAHGAAILNTVATCPTQAGASNTAYQPTALVAYSVTARTGTLQVQVEGNGGTLGADLDLTYALFR